MVELNEKALEAACRAFGSPEPLGYRYVPEGIAAALHAYLAALPAPDDGLVVGWAYDLATNISYEDGKPHYGGWEARISFNEPNVPEGSIRNLRALREAATALQSQAEQIERLTRERDEALTDPYKVMGGIYEKWKARADAAEQQVQKLTAENERIKGQVREAVKFLEEGYPQHARLGLVSALSSEGGK